METVAPRDLLHQFYIANKLPPQGGITDPIVRIEIAPGFALFIPNFDAHRMAVIRHDVHHLVTGYSASTLAGESEISAWELASGCKTYWAATVINMYCAMIGVPFNLRNLLKAFTRGRRTKNLYDKELTKQEFLHMPLDELKHRLLLDEHPAEVKPHAGDVFRFVLFILAGTVYCLLTSWMAVLVALYSLYVVVFRRYPVPHRK